MSSRTLRRSADANRVQGSILTDPCEADAVRSLLRALRRNDMPPLFAAVLFGSKARGDSDARSDIDVLVVCDVPEACRAAAARAVHIAAERVSRRHGVDLEAWTISRSGLRRGRRTPMLVDALADGIPLWPPDLMDVRLPFTPVDARFCAACLLDWWYEGAPLVRRAIRRGNRVAAAARIRDDITRLATAALLLTGETRHRRAASLQRFRNHFIAAGIIAPQADLALRWAELAYPRGDWRGATKPPPSRIAVQTVDRGLEAAALMESLLVPWILCRMRQLANGVAAWPPPAARHCRTPR